MAITVTTPAESFDLTTLATLKDELGLASSDTSEDTRLSRMVTEVSRAIERYTRRVWPIETVTEKLQGRGYLRLILSRRPIVAISEIRDEDVALLAADWEIENRRSGFVRKETRWTSSAYSTGGIAALESPEHGKLVWEVDYSGGYHLPSFAGSPGANEEALPEDVERAALEWLVHLYRARGRDPGIQQERVGDYSVTYRAGQMPGCVAELLGPWRRLDFP